MINVQLEKLLKNVLDTAQIYYTYMEKYWDTWDIENQEIAQGTLGNLIIMANQIKDLKNSSEDLQNEKAIIEDSLFKITDYINYINKNICDFV
jgi:hypothetical protein